MTFFELASPVLVALLVIVTGVVGWLCVRAELRLASRRHVQLSNYRQSTHLFYIQKDLTTSVTTAGVAFLTLAMLIACLVLPVVRAYAIVLALLLAVQGAVAFLSLSRGKCARDVRMFDTYYVKVENLLANKEQTLADIKACRRRSGELRTKLTQTQSAFNSYLSKPLEGDFVAELFAPIEQMLSEHFAEIDRFSAEITQSFSAALLEFLRDNTQPELRVVPLRSFHEHVVDELLEGVKTTYGTRIAADVIREVERGAVVNAESLGKIVTLLHELEVEVEGETLLHFLQSAAHFEDRDKLMTLLYHNRQIPAAMVTREFLQEGWAWTFVPAMAAAYNRRELGIILTALLEGDHATRCAGLLEGLDATRLDLLEDVMRNTADRAGKRAMATAKAVSLLLSQDFAVGNSGNLYETLALFLRDHGAELGLDEAQRQRIGEIVVQNAFCAAADELSSLYEAARRRGTALVASTKRVLLQYFSVADDTFLSPRRLAALYSEYAFTLSFGDISVMRQLLAAWMLLHTEEADVIQPLLAELKRMPAVKNSSVAPTPENAEKLAQEILEQLKKKYIVPMRALIYRTESKRQTLDAVLAL